MRLLISPHSSTATVACCPQCAAMMSIKLVEPRSEGRALKTWHVFECQDVVYRALI